MTSDTCPSCGESLRPDANYCRSCGSAVTGIDDSSMADAEQPIDDATERAAGEWTADEVEDGKLLAAVSHLLTIVTWLFGPLIIILVSENPFVVQNAKNAVMWQLMLMIYSIVAAILVFILVGIPLLIALWFLNLAFVIIATIRASEGTAWQYPLTPGV